MGYTHYWRRAETLPADANEKWGHALEIAGKIVRSSPVPLAWESDEPGRPPETGDCIRFNGVGEDGYETFRIEGNVVDLRSFECCKTAHRPYDVVITAVLATLKHCAPDCITVSSDGSPSEWAEGIALAREVTGLPIGPPMTEDEWSEGFVDDYQPTIRAEYRELVGLASELRSGGVMGLADFQRYMGGE